MSEKSDLLYITNPGCGWCKKSDPHVAALKKQGYSITTLDMSNADEAKRANEVKMKHSIHCGTPLFVDDESGNSVCGFRELEVLTKWADGEEIPAPPRPQPQQQRPQGNDNDGGKAHILNFYNFRLEVWKEAKNILLDEFYASVGMSEEQNKEVPPYPTADQIKTMAEKIYSFIQTKS